MTRAANNQIIDGDCTAREFSSSPAEQRYLCAYCGRPFSGNIGFHHVHHVNPRIPNYRLEECHNADAGFQSASTLTLRTALRALRYVLWDSDLERLVPFRLAAAG